MSDKAPRQQGYRSDICLPHSPENSCRFRKRQAPPSNTDIYTQIHTPFCHSLKRTEFEWTSCMQNLEYGISLLRLDRAKLCKKKKKERETEIWELFLFSCVFIYFLNICLTNLLSVYLCMALILCFSILFFLIFYELIHSLLYLLMD